jgi:hypothetical protein
MSTFSDLKRYFKVIMPSFPSPFSRRRHFASSFQFNFMVVFMTLANTVLIGRMVYLQARFELEQLGYPRLKSIDLQI